MYSRRRTTSPTNSRQRPDIPHPTDRCNLQIQQKQATSSANWPRQSQKILRRIGTIRCVTDQSISSVRPCPPRGGGGGGSVSEQPYPPLTRACHTYPSKGRTDGPRAKWPDLVVRRIAHKVRPVARHQLCQHHGWCAVAQDHLRTATARRAESVTPTGASVCLPPPPRRRGARGTFERSLPPLGACLETTPGAAGGVPMPGDVYPSQPLRRKCAQRCGSTPARVTASARASRTTWDGWIDATRRMPHDANKFPDRKPGRQTDRQATPSPLLLERRLPYARPVMYR
jgi:hypothetical protein